VEPPAPPDDPVLWTLEPVVPVPPSVVEPSVLSVVVAPLVEPEVAVGPTAPDSEPAEQALALLNTSRATAPSPSGERASRIARRFLGIGC